MRAHETQPEPRSHRTRSDGAGLDRASVAVVCAAAAMLLAGLGQRDLWAPDEPRYAQVAQEVLHGSAERGPSAWLLLRLAGEAYTQKPPLYYWLAAAAGAPAGFVGEWAARLPSALAGIACVALTALLGRRLFPGSSAGPWAAALLLTVYRFGHLARRVQLDVLLTALELGALVLLWSMSRPGKARRGSVAGLHLLLGLALLTKGPVGLLPLAVAFAFLAWEGRASALRGAFPAWAFALSLGPVLLWLGAAVALAPPGFFGDAVVENLFGRFFSGTSHARPFYYYALQLPLDFLPWTLLWPAAWREARRVLAASERRDDPAEALAWRFLIAWVAVFLVFFTLSAGKRGLYLLPAFPALALMCGRTVDRALARRSEWPRWLRMAMLAAAGLVGGAGAWVAFAGGLEIEAAPGFGLPATFGAALASACGGALLLARLWPRAGPPALRRTVATVIGLGLVETAVWTLAYPAFDPEKSPRPVAEAALRATSGDAPIGVFDHRSMVGGLAYYAGRDAVDIPDARALGRFWRRGGGAVAVSRDKLDRLQPPGMAREVETVRSGRRAIAIVVPADRVPSTGDAAP